MKRKSDNETKAGRKRQRQGEIDEHTTDRRDKETEKEKEKEINYTSNLKFAQLSTAQSAVPRAPIIPKLSFFYATGFSSWTYRTAMSALPWWTRWSRTSAPSPTSSTGK